MKYWSRDFDVSLLNYQHHALTSLHLNTMYYHQQLVVARRVERKLKIALREDKEVEKEIFKACDELRSCQHDIAASTTSTRDLHMMTWWHVMVNRMTECTNGGDNKWMNVHSNHRFQQVSEQVLVLMINVKVNFAWSFCLLWLFFPLFISILLSFIVRLSFTVTQSRHQSLDNHRKD